MTKTAAARPFRVVFTKLQGWASFTTKEEAERYARIQRRLGNPCDVTTA